MRISISTSVSCAVLLLHGPASSPAQSSPERSTINLQTLSRALRTDHQLPIIRIEGSFAFYSAFQSQELIQRSSAKFIGVLDLASERLDFTFSRYVQTTEGTTSPFRTSDFRVIFNGYKWVKTRIPQNGELPAEITSLTEISFGIPQMFLKTLDPFCFPLFVSLTEVNINGKTVDFLEQIEAIPSTELSVELVQQEDQLILTFQSQNVSDIYYFSPGKNFAMTKRVTNFNLPPELDGSKQSLRNELLISELAKVGGLWLPKSAEFFQYRNGNQIIQRVFSITSVEILASHSFQAVIPADSYVTDKIHNESFRTFKEEILE